MCPIYLYLTPFLYLFLVFLRPFTSVTPISTCLIHIPSLVPTSISIFCCLSLLSSPTSLLAFLYLFSFPPRPLLPLIYSHLYMFNPYTFFFPTSIFICRCLSLPSASTSLLPFLYLFLVFPRPILPLNYYHLHLFNPFPFLFPTLSLYSQLYIHLFRLSLPHSFPFFLFASGSPPPITLPHLLLSTRV